ncbi:LamG domain-containing protein [Aeoliella mucimassa]|uniref:LamG-like jellyroll fold domain-containing protein n=1 Tax=Aeoliella mucimassa TaxID=2527972 RepID=A0A518API2_9BACT|nr:LamG domain-containing protein [Aeoliella mucimassa]QDU56635.1 hypothetical protein Pan181_28450 [Aeoliella mucimassa]
MDNYKDQDELFLLLELAMTGRADDSQLMRLQWLLEHDSEARELYARAWMLDVDLRQVLQSSSGMNLHVDSCAACEDESSADTVKPAPHTSWQHKCRTLIGKYPYYLAVSLLLVVGVVGYTAGRNNWANTGERLARSNGPSAAEEARNWQTSAIPLQARDLRVHLTKASRCVWGNATGDSKVFNPGNVERGESLELLEGFATFAVVADNWEASIQIEGPAGIVVTSEALPALRHGQMLVNVTSASKPLVVDLPYAEVNLMPGSEVGVLAFGGLCEVHVFRGVASVESLWNMAADADVRSDGAYVVPEGTSISMGVTDANYIKLTEGAANRGMFDASEFRKGGQLVVTNDYIEQVLAAKPIAYWRFEQIIGGLIENTVQDNYALRVYGDVCIDGLTGNRFLSFPLDENAGHQRFLCTTKPITSALPGDYSIEFWVNPSHFHTATIFTFLVPEMGRREMMTTWNDNPVSQHGLLIELGGFSGKVGLMQPRRIRSVHRSPADCVGGTSSFSDRDYTIREWQHVTCVKQGKKLCVYLNGELVSQAEDDTNLPGNLSAVIGQISDTRFERSFYGQIDELAVYDHALSVDEIRSHRQAAHFVGTSLSLRSATSQGLDRKSE